MTVEPQAALVEFRHSYTKLCTAMVHALRVGKHRERVRRAGAAGGLIPHDRCLASVREARLRATMKLDDAKAVGVSGDALIETARQGRDAIEAEWMLRLPLGVRP